MASLSNEDKTPSIVISFVFAFTGASVIDFVGAGSIELPGVTELVFFEPQPTRPDTEMTTIIITETALYIILKNTFLFIRTPIQNLSVLVSYIITIHLYLQEIPAYGCLRM